MFCLQNPMAASRQGSTAVLGDKRANFVAVFLKFGWIRDRMLDNQISSHVGLLSSTLGACSPPPSSCLADKDKVVILDRLAPRMWRLTMTVFGSG